MELNFEKELDRLNPYQREAVLDESPACVVNANVGSGKTTVLITKIQYLHHIKKVGYEDMTVLTFTNKAADEIKSRLLAAEPELPADKLRGFGTFHSTALYYLREFLPVEDLGYSKEFLVIDPEEELELAYDLIRQHKLKIKYKNRLKKRLESAMAVREEEKKVSKYQDDIYELAGLLKEEKAKQDKMTFFDLLENANFLLKEAEQKSVSPKWVIIDEVQDSDTQQLVFTDRLISRGASLFAVGDPNQVIYSWRGSAFQIFYTLKHKYQAKELTLPINYRSSTSILEAARCFLQNGSPLTGVREPGSKIIVRRQYDAFQDACYLAARMKKLHEEGISYGEMAVFYRLQSQSKIFEDVFLREGIPFEVSLKKTVGDVPVLKWCIRLLRFSLNTKDTASGIYVLSSREYGEGISGKKAEEIVRAGQPGKSLLFDRMCGLVENCRELGNEEELFTYFELDRYLNPVSASFHEDSDAVRRLFGIMYAYVREQQAERASGMREFVNSSSLYGSDVLREDISRQEDRVKLMTIHASKGLEFSCVFITGVNHGLIPLRTGDMEGEEEERRLFFVGITRAKDHLELSYYMNPQERADPGESRYIRMIPPRLLEHGEDIGPAVSLQELKRQVQEQKRSIAARGSEQSPEQSLEQSPGQSLEQSPEQSPGQSLEQSPEQSLEQSPGQSLEQSLEQRPEQSSEQSPEQSPEQAKQQKLVRHSRYGTGVVVNEDETMLEAEFEGYGKKEFIKAFSELEYI